MADGNTGGADATGTTTGATGLSGSGTGQTAQPGKNPIDAGTAGNDDSKINEATGAKGLAPEGSDPAGVKLIDIVAENGQDPEKVAEQRRDEEKARQHVGLSGDGSYDRGTGRVLGGSVEVTDGNGVVVTKTLG